MLYSVSHKKRAIVLCKELACSLRTVQSLVSRLRTLNSHKDEEHHHKILRVIDHLLYQPSCGHLKGRNRLKKNNVVWMQKCLWLFPGHRREARDVIIALGCRHEK